MGIITGKKIFCAWGDGKEKDDGGPGLAQTAGNGVGADFRNGYEGRAGIERR